VRTRLTLKKRLALIALTSVCVLPVFGPIAYFSYWGQVNKQFLEKENAVEPLFIQMNQDIWHQVPAPEGVSIVESYNSDGHGSVLTIRYKNEKLTFEEISAYYDHILIGMNWIVLKKFLSGNLYTNGTGCFQVDYYDRTGDEYYVYIQEEYFKQPFIPPMPPRWSIDLYDFREKRFSGCSEQ